MTYTPTTEEVRDGYSYAGTRQEFDRWYAEEISKAKAQALEEAADAFEGGLIRAEAFTTSSEGDKWRLANEARQVLIDSLRNRAQQLKENK